MELTGKCKEDFEKWLNSSEKYIRINPILNVEIDLNNIYIFGLLTTSMQYGVYVDFFDSVDIKISMNQHNKDFWVDIQKTFFESDMLLTRAEARIVAIEKANEIYNKI